jgi:hypothetical protein
LVAENRKNSFSEPVRLFEVGVSGQDEFVETKLVVLGDPFSDFFV